LRSNLSCSGSWWFHETAPALRPLRSRQINTAWYSPLAASRSSRDVCADQCLDHQGPRRRDLV